MAYELSVAHRVQWELFNSDFRTWILEQWRASATDDDWWHSVYDQCIEENAALGIGVESDSIRFSGFSSQGDGACFNAHVSDWEKFLTAVGVSQLWPAVRDYGINNEHGYRPMFKMFYGGGRYCHEFMTREDHDLYLYGTWPHWEEQDVDVLRIEAWKQRTKGGQILQDCQEAFEQFFRGRMRKLYRDLEDLHNTLTSDNAIIEEILDMHTAEELVEKQRNFLHEMV